MSEKYEKRRYQERTVEAFDKWKDSDSALATIILPCGTGKTVTASLCLKTLGKRKILWVAHREELIDQAYNTLAGIIKDCVIDKEIAKYKASPNADIIIGSVQTLARKRKHLDGFVPEFIVIDEYHHRSEKNVTYQGLLDRFPKARVLGLTATPWRFSGELLPLGTVLFNMDIGTAVSHNYLVHPKPEALQSNVSLANVKTHMGDFATADLSKVVNVDDRNKLIAKKILEYIKEQKRQGILFGVDVAHAHAMYELLKKDCRAIEIYGDTPKDERRYLIEKLRNQEVDVFVNNLVCTEGADFPHLSFAAIARPTRALGLYLQMSGRPLRLYPNKANAIILDVFDKIKIRQSRITFVDMAAEGDLYGEKKRAASLLDAELSTSGSGSGGESKDYGEFAKKLSHFPIFIRRPSNDRWTTDNKFLPITSWIIAAGQRIVTWTEEVMEQKLIAKDKLIPFTAKPSTAECRARCVKVKHETLGAGIIIDDGLGVEVRVEFEPSGWIQKHRTYVPISKLSRLHTVKEFAPNRERRKLDKLFYFCFPDGASEGRVIEMTRDRYELIISADQKMTLDDAKTMIVSKAKSAGILPLVRADAYWKKGAASQKQKDLLLNWIRGKKIGFDLDMGSVTKGDASAIIDQMKWQDIINSRFGTNSKEKLLGYDKSADDV